MGVKTGSLYMAKLRDPTSSDLLLPPKGWDKGMCHHAWPCQHIHTAGLVTETLSLLGSYHPCSLSHGRVPPLYLKVTSQVAPEHQAQKRLKGTELPSSACRGLWCPPPLSPCPFPSSTNHRAPSSTNHRTGTKSHFSICS